MQITEGESSIAIILEPGEARTLLEILDGRQGPTLGFLRQALDHFLDEPEEEGT